MSIRKRQWKTGSGEPKTAWVCDFTDQAGKRRVRQFSRKSDAVAFATKANAEVAAGKYIDRKENPTLGEAAPLWFEYLQAREAAGELTRGCRIDYETKMSLHLLNPNYGLGRVKVSMLDWGQIDQFRLRMIAHKSPARQVNNSAVNARKTLAILKQFLRWAWDSGLTAANPMAGRRVKQDRAAKSRDHALAVPSHETIKALFAAADKRGHETGEAVGLAVRVAAITGLRAGELWGLDWNGINFETATLTVKQRLDRFGDIGDPKSAAGVRTVPIPPDLLLRLKQHWLASGKSGAVFTAKGKRIAHPAFLKRHWQPILKDVGVKLRWHSLRHFALSAWFEAGCSLRVGQERIGHSDAAITMKIYSHVLSGDAGEDMSALEARLS